MSQVITVPQDKAQKFILHSWLINVTSTKYVNLLLLRGNVKEEVLLFMYRVIYL